MNGDGCVDDTDFLAIFFALGTQAAAEDITCDGTVGDDDLLEVLFNLGSGC